MTEYNPRRTITEMPPMEGVGARWVPVQHISASPAALSESGRARVAALPNGARLLRKRDRTQPDKNGRKYDGLREVARLGQVVQLSDGYVFPPQTPADRGSFVQAHPGIARALGWKVPDKGSR